MNWKKRGVVAVLLLVTGCLDEGGSAVSQEQFGEQWPLTVPSGRVTCDSRAGRDPIITFIALNGKKYALNNHSMNSAQRPSKIDLIQKPDPINPSAKKSIKPLADEALKICPPPTMPY
jgi:hypothetical protein